MKRFTIGFALGALCFAGLLKVVEELDEDFVSVNSGCYPSPGFRS